MLQSARKILLAVILVTFVVTWLPYFDILNAPVFWGPFPQPLAVTLICNVVLTICVFAIYVLYFRPFIRTAEKAGLNRD